MRSPILGPMRPLLVVTALTVLALPVRAQIEPGRIYTAGEEIREPSLGLRLTLPAGWRGALSPDGSSFMLEPVSGEGLMVVIADRLTEAQAREQLSQPIDVGGGIVLVPAGEVREVATGHPTGAFDVRGAPSGYQGTVDVRLTAGGLGVAFVLLSPSGSAASQREAMRAFAFSLGVEAAAVGGRAGGDGAGVVDEWEPYLRGRYLARFFTRTGYTESAELWLCSDGTFYYDSQGGGFGGGASGAMQSRGGGRWSATGAGASGTLFLDWAGGGRTSLSLGYDAREDKLYVDGERMLRGNNERCH